MAEIALADLPNPLVFAPIRRLHPSTHFLVAGPSGVGKSRFATTFRSAGPLRVFVFDALAKTMQYLRGFDYSPLIDVDYSLRQNGSCLVPTRYVFDSKRRVWCQLEHFWDHEWEIGTVREWHNDAWKEIPGVGVMKPSAYQRFLAVMGSVRDSEVATGPFATYCLDSLGSAADAAKNWAQFTLNPHSKEPRQWYGSATDRIAHMFQNRWASLPINTLVLAHIARNFVEKDPKSNRRSPKEEVMGQMLFRLSAPGRLSENDGLPRGFGEFYFMYADAAGGRWLQTRIEGHHNASTQIDAPEPCAPHYEAVWENWK